MTAKITYTEVEVGTELPAQTFPVTRATLVQYAGASGDFNPIHWNEKFAVEVGLPDVIAHGMFTMAEAIRVVTDWVGDPERSSSTASASPSRSSSRTTARAPPSRSAARSGPSSTTTRSASTSSPYAPGQKVLGMSRAVVRLG